MNVRTVSVDCAKAVVAWGHRSEVRHPRRCAAALSTHVRGLENAAVELVGCTGAQQTNRCMSSDCDAPSTSSSCRPCSCAIHKQAKPSPLVDFNEPRAATADKRPHPHVCFEAHSGWPAQPATRCTCCASWRPWRSAITVVPRPSGLRSHTSTVTPLWGWSWRALLANIACKHLASL